MYLTNIAYELSSVMLQIVLQLDDDELEVEESLVQSGYNLVSQNLGVYIWNEFFVQNSASDSDSA